MRNLYIMSAFFLFGLNCADAKEKDADFIRAYVYNDYLLTCIPSDLTIRLYSTILSDPSFVHTKFIWSADRPSSFAVGYKHLYIGYHFREPLGSFRNLTTEYIQLSSADAFCFGQWQWIDIKAKKGLDFKTETFWLERGYDSDIRIKALRRREDVFSLQRDIVPIGEMAVLRFELIFDPKVRNAGRMYVYRVERMRDDDGKLWKLPEMKLLEEFDTEFAEPFQAAIVDKDYVFITLTGKIYRFGPPVKDEKRTGIEEKWPGPIVALITNANAPNSHYAIGRKDKDWRFYVSLAKGAKPKFFNSSSWLRPVMHSDEGWHYAYELIRGKEFSVPEPMKSP